MNILKRAIVAMALLAFPAISANALEVSKDIAAYSKVSGVSGQLNSIGSDTLANLMTLWAESFRKIYPNVKIQIEAKGSSTAPPALIAGTSQIGPMSRQMKASEIEKFEKAFGYKPTKIRVSLDALSVFVHKDNPVESLDLKEIDGIFSKNRRSGAEDISDWKKVNGRQGKIRMYGRNSASGTYGFFKKKALFKGDYKSSVKEQPGSASVVQSVGRDKNGIGYSGMGYKTSRVKALKLSKKGGKAYPAKPKYVYNGKYPLSRFLYVYINKKPGKTLDPLVREFLRYVLSSAGQKTNIKDGFIPLSSTIVDEALAKLK